MARYGLYQPFIEDRNVRRLYQLKTRFRSKEHRKIPMTALLNRILDDFFDAQGEIDREEPLWGHPTAEPFPAASEVMS